MPQPKQRLHFLRYGLKTKWNAAKLFVLYSYCQVLHKIAGFPYIIRLFLTFRIKIKRPKIPVGLPPILLRQHRTMGAAGFGGSFEPSAQFWKWEIHKVFPHFQNFWLNQNLPLSALADLLWNLLPVERQKGQTTPMVDEKVFFGIESDSQYRCGNCNFVA